MDVRTCDHLKEDGFYCKSPALRDRNYCYFHLNLRGRRLNMARARALGPEQPINLPFPEDMHAVQVSLGEVINRLANNQIDPKHAGLILYALQQAATNLNHTPEWQGRCQPVEPNEPMLALEFPDFEEQYHVPKGIDLEADPETALQEVTPPLDMPPEAAAPGAQNPGRNNNGGNATNERKRRPGARVPLPKGALDDERPRCSFPRLHQRWPRVDPRRCRALAEANI
jgi:hypothetical protein